MKKIYSLVLILISITVFTGCTSKKVKLNLADMQGEDTKISLDDKEYSENKVYDESDDDSTKETIFIFLISMID